MGVAMSHRTLARHLPACALVLLLAGCGSTAGYPSLALQPGERVAARPNPVPAPAPAPAGLSAASSARIARLIDQLGAAHRHFVALDSARAGVFNAASGAAPASDAALHASTALGELEAARANSSGIASLLDAAYVDDRLANAVADGEAAAGAAPRPTAAALAAARDQALAMRAEEAAVRARRGLR